MKKIEDLFSLKGKYNLITGASGLLGLKHAEAIALAKGNLVLTDIDTELLSSVCKFIKETYQVECLYFSMDVTNESSVEFVNSQLNSNDIFVDILINNAARNPKVEAKNTNLLNNRLESLDLNSWNNDLAVGLTGSVICAKIFGTKMAERNFGNIINISSDLGIIAPDQRLYRDENKPESQQNVKPLSYSVIKHGLIGLTKYLSTYWLNKNIRSNALSPGGVFNHQDDIFLNRIKERIPFGRMASANEYQAAIIFLASEASSYMNGANLVIDGGRSVW